MKKIAFLITSTGWGGLEMNVLKLAKGLQDSFEIILYVRKDSRLFEKTKEAQLQLIPIKQHRKNFDFKNAKVLSKTLKIKEIKTLLVFDNKDLGFIALIKRYFFPSLRVIYQQHMQIGINKRDLIHTQRFLKIDTWVSPLHWLKEEIRKQTRFPLERVRVIPIGLITENFETIPSKEAARNSFQIQSDRPLLGILGRISPKKGQDFLIKAVSALKERKIEVDLLIVGEPTINDPECINYYRALRALTEKLDLEDRIHFRPFTSTPLDFYGAIDIFALASHGETYGMVTLEAMLSGTAVIGTNTSGTPEILRKGQLGVLYKVNDIPSFCEGIESILNDKHIKVKLDIAREEVLENYSFQKEKEEFIKLLNDE